MRGSEREISLIIIANPYFRFRDTVSVGQIERTTPGLFAELERDIVGHYRERTGLAVDIELRVEQGSTKVWVTVITLANAIIFYGSLRQSVDYLIQDAKWVSDQVLPVVKDRLGIVSDDPEYVERRLGVPGEMKRLIAEVEEGRLSPADATEAAIGALGLDGDAEFSHQSADTIRRQLHDDFAAVASSARRRPREVVLEIRPSSRVASEQGPKFPLAENRALPIISNHPRRGAVVTRSRNGALKIKVY